MTKIERFIEIEAITLRTNEAFCYWCGALFRKTVAYRKPGIKGGDPDNNPSPVGWCTHININFENKIFCSDKCKLDWIYHKTIFGELMP